MTKPENKTPAMPTKRTFLRVGTCSEAACNVINRAFENPLELEEKATATLAGGILQHGYQCGLLWGAALAAGARSYELHGATPKAEMAAIRAAGRVLESFEGRHHEINCMEIACIDWRRVSQMLRFFLKGGPVGCFRMAGKFAPVAYREIEAELDDDDTDAPELPVGCAAVVVRRMGLSEKQAVMASGWAGGIGLCGGACGALGAAIWATNVRNGQESGGKIDYKDPRAAAVIERFLKASDHEFECEKIVGRRFESVEDHAAYIREGGCAKLIDALVSE